MAAYSRVYDSRHLQADCQEPASDPEPYTWWLVIDYGLPLPFLHRPSSCRLIIVAWTAAQNWRFLNLKREMLYTVKARKLAYYGHTMRKQGSCLEKEILQGTTPGACRRGRPRTAWMNNIKTWTGLSVEESIRMTEDRDKLRKYIHGVANPRIEDG